MFKFKKLEQPQYIILLVSIGFVLAVFIGSNENIVGKVGFQKFPSAIGQKVNIPGFEQKLKIPTKCPTGSIEITQSDIDQATQSGNHGYIITQPGNYCLKEDLIVNSNRLNSLARGGMRIITIQSDKVTLDMNGNSLINTHGSKALAGSYGSGFDAINIWNPGQKTHDITIKNGLIKGFDSGIAFASTGGFEDVIVKEITLIENYGSIFIHEAKNVIVQNNIIINSRNGINVATRRTSDSGNVLIENNNLFGIRSDGIQINKISGATINSNIFDKLDLMNYPYQAIDVTDSHDVIINNNQISNHQLGIGAGFSTTGSYAYNTFCNINNQVSVVLPAILRDAGGNNLNAQNC